ncbi:MAG TPA: hypothetical protein VMW72_01905 [Sedimentisphaerales bacterium]|nr:hypothetical protein [Sedimentisphaerales bacterium]
MNGINEAFEKIVGHKAKLIKKSTGYEKYIKDVLKKRGIRDSEEIVKVFKMGAVDGMIYDIGAALDFTKQKHSVDDWTSYKKRKEMLMKLFAR